jgi:hypothetical protein
MHRRKNEVVGGSAEDLNYFRAASQPHQFTSEILHNGLAVTYLERTTSPLLPVSVQVLCVSPITAGLALPSALGASSFFGSFYPCMIRDFASSTPAASAGPTPAIALIASRQMPAAAMAKYRISTSQSPAASFDPRR